MNILTKLCVSSYLLTSIHRNAQVQVWLAPLPIHSCVGAIANRGQWEQGCRLFMATDLGPVRTTRKKKYSMTLHKLCSFWRYHFRHSCVLVCNILALLFFHFWSSSFDTQTPSMPTSQDVTDQTPRKIAITIFLSSICPPLGLLLVLGPLERYMTPTLDAALLCRSRAGSDLGRTSDWLRSFIHWLI